MKTILEKNESIKDSFSKLITSFNLVVTGFGSVKTDNNDSPEDNWQDIYRINYINSGEIYFNFKGERILLKQGTIVILPPGYILSPIKDHIVDISFINFAISNPNRYDQFNPFLEKYYPHFHVVDQDKVIFNLVNQLLTEQVLKKDGYAMLSNGLLMSLFVYMHRFSNHITEAIESTDHLNTNMTFNLAVSYIHEHITSKLTVHEIADYVGISDIYLYKLFIKFSGKSPNQFINDYKISIAKEYLTNKNYSIKMISDMLGFSNQNYFSNTFKKKTGLSCSEYRQKIKERNH